MKFILFLSVTLLAGWASSRAAIPSPLFISEFMADNVTGLEDEDGAPSDWIELYNAGAADVNLDGWYLTDNPAALAFWRFPATNLTAGSHLLVFASGKNRTTPGTPLHTSFSLDAHGEYLALISPDGKTVASEFAPYAVCTVLTNLKEDNSIRRNGAFRHLEDEFLDSSLESRTWRLECKRNGPNVAVRRLEDMGEREEAGSA